MNEVDFLLTNAIIVTQNENRDLLNNSALAVQGDRIAAIGSPTELQATYHARETIDCQGAAVFPGLINTHTHLFQCAVKGLGEDMAVQEWVHQVTAPTAAHFGPEEAYLFGLNGCLELIRSGVTTVVDMSYAVSSLSVHEHYIQAILDSGLRGRYSSIISDFGDYGLPPEILKPIDTFLDETARLKALHPDSDRMGIWLAIGAPWVATDHAIRRARAFATETGTFLTMHLNENEIDNELIQQRHGLDAVAYLEEIGFLGPDFLAIHCVVMTPEEIDLLARRGVKVAYNPVSNMYLGSGIAPMVDIAAAGVTVSMGVDGAGSNNSQDMIETLKIGALLQKVGARDAAVIDAQQLLDWATLGGAETLGLAAEIGSLEPGKKADLFVLALNDPKIIPAHDPVTSLVYSAGQQNVSWVMANGRFLMRAGTITQQDEMDVLQQCQRRALQLADRSGANHKVRRHWR